MGDGFSFGQHFDPVIGASGGNDLPRTEVAETQVVCCLAVKRREIAAYPQVVAVDEQRTDFEIGIYAPGRWRTRGGVNHA